MKKVFFYIFKDNKKKYILRFPNGNFFLLDSYKYATPFDFNELEAQNVAKLWSGDFYFGTQVYFEEM